VCSCFMFGCAINIMRCSEFYRVSLACVCCVVCVMLLCVCSSCGYVVCLLCSDINMSFTEMLPRVLSSVVCLFLFCWSGRVLYEFAVCLFLVLCCYYYSEFLLSCAACV